MSTRVTRSAAAKQRLQEQAAQKKRAEEEEEKKEQEDAMEQEEEEEESVQYELPTTDYAQLMQLLINRHVREHGDKPLGEAALSNLLRFARQKRDVDNAKEVEAALVALRNGTQDMAEFRGRVMLAGNGGLIWHQYADEAWIEAMRKGALAARRLPAQ